MITAAVVLDGDSLAIYESRRIVHVTIISLHHPSLMKGRDRRFHVEVGFRAEAEPKSEYQEDTTCRRCVATHSVLHRERHDGRSLHRTEATTVPVGLRVSHDVSEQMPSCSRRRHETAPKTPRFDPNQTENRLRQRLKTTAERRDMRSRSGWPLRDRYLGSAVGCAF